jgi:hypothetical protein
VTETGRRLVPLGAVALLWAAALALPALRIRGGPVLDGADLLLRGWQGASRGIFAWYANPLFAAALGLAALGRDGAAALLSLLALGLALSSLALEPLLRLRMSSVPEIDFSAGLYVWLAAIFVLALRSSLWAYRGRRRPRQIDDTEAETRD